MNTEQREIKSAEWRKNNLSKNSVMDLLSNENMYKKSELHSAEIGDNGELCRVSIKESSFETGFMCARKIILDALKNNT